MLFVFFALSHDRRRIVHVNVTTHPTAIWTAQQLGEVWPWADAPRFLIRDRDSIYGEKVVTVAIPPSLAANVVLNRKRLAFIEAYFGPAGQNPTEAARIAGFKQPGNAGWRLKQDLAEVLEAEAHRRAESRIAGPQEVMEILTEIARDRTHKDRRGASQDLAKIHGLLSERLTIESDRAKLIAALREGLQGLTQQALLPAAQRIIDLDVAEEPVDTGAS